MATITYYFLKQQKIINKSQKQKELRFFLLFFTFLKDPDPYLVLIDLDPDPGGP